MAAQSYSPEPFFIENVASFYLSTNNSFQSLPPRQSSSISHTSTVHSLDGFFSDTESIAFDTTRAYKALDLGDASAASDDILTNDARSQQLQIHIERRVAFASTAIFRPNIPLSLPPLTKSLGQHCQEPLEPRYGKKLGFDFGLGKTPSLETLAHIFAPESAVINITAANTISIKREPTYSAIPWHIWVSAGAVPRYLTRFTPIHIGTHNDNFVRHITWWTLDIGDDDAHVLVVAVNQYGKIYPVSHPTFHPIILVIPSMACDIIYPPHLHKTALKQTQARSWNYKGIRRDAEGWVRRYLRAAVTWLKTRVLMD